MYKVNSIWILGSTSEIAQEICTQFARSGCKKFFLIARDKKKNQKFIDNLKNKYDIHIENQEVDLLSDYIPKENEYLDYDLYIITAGFLGSNYKKKNLSEELNILKINFISLISWIKSIVTKERVKKQGCLWIFSSVAGDRGRPSNYQYGAAKAGLTIYCEGLANIYQKSPFSIRIIKAGLIRTSMVKGNFPNFLFTDKVKIVSKLRKDPYKNGVEYMPTWWKFIMLIIKSLPSFLMKKL